MNGIKSQNIRIGGSSSGPRICSWQNGSEDDIVAMVHAADIGEIDLHDYWSVGDYRTVHLSAIPAASSGAFVNGIAERDLKLYIVDTQYYINKSKGYQSGINFVISPFLDGHYMEARMHSSASNSGSYNSSKMNTALKSKDSTGFIYYLPRYIQTILKDFTVSTISEYNGSTLQTVTTPCALMSAGEIIHDTKPSSMTQTEYDNVKQLKIFETLYNRMALSASEYIWTRTPSSASSKEYALYYYDSGDHIAHANANSVNKFVPMMCI